jgi:hypothetical protein
VIAVRKRLQNGDFLERMDRQNVEKTVEPGSFSVRTASVPGSPSCFRSEKLGNLPQIGEPKFKSTPNKISINLLLYNTYSAYPFCLTGQ